VVTGGTWEQVNIETVSGSLRFEGGLNRRSTLEAETVSGSAELALPSDLGIDFQLSTFSGNIENDLGPAPTKQSRWTPEKELSFSIGGGGAKVTVQTLSGGIRLRKRQ
jgi:DUF4097 and DUF4098 domain-containing protein YvlB